MGGMGWTDTLASGVGSCSAEDLKEGKMGS